MYNKNVHTTRAPTLNLATKKLRAERASGHEAGRYYRAKHPERLAARHPGHTTNSGRCGLSRAARQFFVDIYDMLAHPTAREEVVDCRRGGQRLQ